MSNYDPLFLVAITLFTLWFLGKVFARSAKRITNSRTLKQRAQILKRFSVEITPGLHVSGLDEQKVEELKKSIQRKDDLRIAIFLATHRPFIYELEDLLEKLKEQFLFLVGANLESASEFDKISAANSLQIPNHPESFRFSSLSKNELRVLCEFDHDQPPAITGDLIEKFGDLLFMENFIMYDHLCRETPAIFHIPESSEVSRLFTTFLKTGLAVQGKEIPLHDRLYILSLEQLQDMANEVKLKKEFETKEEAIEALAEVPSASVLLATIYPTNELHLLLSEPRDVKAVEREWLVYNSHAKLLCVTNPNQPAN